MFKLFNFERDLSSKGIKLIAGVDEVGRGPLAGPMVVSAVVLNIETLSLLDREELTNNDIFNYSKINDSKKLTANSREKLDDFIRSVALSYTIIEVSNEEIDERGISAVTQTAFFDAVKNLKIKPEMVITDNFPIKKLLPQSQINLPKGDSLSMSVAAASIIGKVYRDALMRGVDKMYPMYGFEKHKGYGTAEHIGAIRKYGICPLHRKSFEPVKSLIANVRV